jgi:hypothetical protein
MKKMSILALVVLTSITQTHIAEAATTLKVTVKEYNSVWMAADRYIFVKGDAEALAFKKKITAFAKTSKAKSEALAECKGEDSVYFNTRIKVLDARNGTAGLGNLKSVTVSNMKIAEESNDLPQYTDEEAELLDEEYFTYDEYPDYIEEGYVSYYIEFICSNVGTVSLITSNAYKVYIDGDFAGEYSRTELVKKKWSLIYEDY